MRGYTFVCSKEGFKKEYFPLDNLGDYQIKQLLKRMENNGYLVECVKEV
jgi:hypothetical protein